MCLYVCVTNRKTETPGLVATGAWFAALDFLAVLEDAEIYETEQIKGADIPRVWAEAQWMDNLADAPDDQLARFIAHVTDQGNWYHGNCEPCRYKWPITEGDGGITFIRLTHLKANVADEPRPRDKSL